jgi:hypothetical protein
MLEFETCNSLAQDITDSAQRPLTQTLYSYWIYVCFHDFHVRIPNLPIVVSGDNGEDGFLVS